MASGDAWDIGAGLAQSKKAKKKKTDDDDDSTPKAKGQPVGGLLGLAGKGVGKLVGSFKRGGHVKRTGLALLHRGEYVVPASHRRAATKKATRKHSVIKA